MQLALLCNKCVTYKNMSKLFSSKYKGFYDTAKMKMILLHLNSAQRHFESGYNDKQYKHKSKTVYIT